MWPATSRFFDTLARSHVQKVRIDVLHDGQLEQRIDSTTVPDPASGSFIQSIGGSVKVDRATIRRDGTVEFLDLSGQLLADDVDELFAPMIAELRIWVGVQYHDFTEAERLAGADVEYVPVATLVVTEVQNAYPVVTVSGFDRLWYLAPFVGNYPVAAGTLTHVALANVLTSQIPAAHLQLNIPETEFVTGALLYEEQSDSADAAHALAVAMGMALYADPMGVVTVAPEPSTEDPPAMTYEPGALSMLMRPQRGVSAADVKNAVVFTGESPDGAPVRGYAEDTNAESLTYAGRVGVRADFQSSPLIRTAPQAQLAAQTALNRVLGLADNIVVPVIPNPALESGDVIRVVDPTQSLDLSLIADSFSVPLRASDGGQTITCRARVLR